VFKENKNFTTTPDVLSSGVYIYIVKYNQIRIPEWKKRNCHFNPSGSYSMKDKFEILQFMGIYPEL